MDSSFRWKDKKGMDSRLLRRAGNAFGNDKNGADEGVCRPLESFAGKTRN